MNVYMKGVLWITLVSLPYFLASQKQFAEIEQLLKKTATRFYFEENKGQWGPNIFYKARAEQSVFQFLENSLSIGIQKTSKNEVPSVPYLPFDTSLNFKEKLTDCFVWNLHFKNAQPHPIIQPRDTIQQGQHHYLNTQQQKNITSVNAYSELWYKNIYPNTDLRFYSKSDGTLEYDFILQPHTDPSQIALFFEGIEQIELDEKGRLILSTPFGQLEQGAPYTFQVIDNKEIEIASTYQIHEDGSIGFKIQEAYDLNEPLIIDPTALLWSTYLGTSNYDRIFEVEEAADGGIIVCGATASTDFPTTPGVYQGSSLTDQDCFVSKFSSDASTLIWSSYLGGNDYDNPSSMKLTASGSIVIGGSTRSGDFPTTPSSLEPTFTGGKTAGFISKLNSTGTALEYSTFFGQASGYALILDLVVNTSEEVFFVGLNLPSSGLISTTAGAWQTAPGTGSFQGFAGKITASLDSVLYTTYLPGNKEIYPLGLDVNTNGELVVTGYILATDYPTTANSIQPSSNGNFDGFITKFNAAGSDVIFSTYIGGRSIDLIYKPFIDAVDDIYLVGYSSGTFPVTAGAFQTTHGGSTYDGVVVKMNGTGDTLRYATYWGGSGDELPFSIDVDSNGIAYIGGYAQSKDVPVTFDAFQSDFEGGSYDGIFGKFSADGSELIYGTYIGGEESDYIQDLELSYDGGAILGGYSISENFPVTEGVYQTVRNTARSADDGILFKFGCVNYSNNTLTPPTQTTCKLGVPELIEGTAIEVTVPTVYRDGVPTEQNSNMINYQWQLSLDSLIWEDVGGAIDQSYLPPPASIKRYYRRLALGGNCCPSDTSNVAIIDVNAFFAPTAEAGDPQAYCPSGSVVIGGSPTATGGTSPYSYEWTPSAGLDNPSLANPTVSGSSSGVYTLKLTDANDCIVYDQTVTTVVNADAGPDVNFCANGGYGIQLGTPEVPKIPPFSYSWSPTTGLSDPNAAQPIATPTKTITYTLTVNGGNGCPDTDMVTVTYISVNADAGADASVCQGDNLVIGTAAVGNLEYFWSPSAYLDDPLIDQPTFRSPVIPTTNPYLQYLSVTDPVSGCAALDTVAITVDTVPILDLQEYYCFEPPGSVTIGNPAEIGMTYSWTPSFGLNDTTLAQPSANPSVTTLYSLTVTTSKGCQDTEQCVVSPTCQIPPCVIQQTGPGGGVCNQGGGIQIGPNPVGNFTYVWTPTTGLSDPNIAQPIANPTVTTEYIVEVENAFDPFVICNDTIEVFVPNLPTGLSGLDTTICVGESTTIGSTPIGGVEYAWSPTTSLNDPTFAQPIATPTETTTYFLSATEVNTGCVTEDTITVTVRGPVADAGPDGNFCEGAFVTLGVPALPGQTYLWTPGGGLSDSTIAQPTITLYTGVTFFLLATDSLTGCFLRDTVVYTETMPPLADAALTAQKELCAGSGGVLLGTTDSTFIGYTYTWIPTAGLDNPSSPNPLANPSENTTYTLIVADPNRPGCVSSDQVEVVLSTDAVPTADAGSDQNICPGGSAMIGTTAVGGVTYAWTPTTDLDNAALPQPTANPSVTTIYNLTVTDIGNGCSDMDEVTVIVNDNPAAFAGPDLNLCEGDTVQIGRTAEAGHTYSWTPTATLDDATSATPLAFPSTTTEYALLVTNTTTGCTATDTTNITVNAIPTANGGPDVDVCTTAVAIGTAASGDTYTWSPATGLDNPFTAQPNALPTDTTEYILTVTSAGCQATDTVQVNPAAVINAGANTVVCRGDSVQIGSEAIAGYTYSWSPITGLSDASTAQPKAAPNSSTTYTLTVTNGSCMKTDAVTVLVKTATANAGNNQVICEGATTQIGSTPLANYTYTWYPTDSLDNPNVANPYVTTSVNIEYILFATNNTNGCTQKDTMTVGVFPQPAPDADAGADIIVCYGIGDFIGTETIKNMTYAWSPTTNLNNPYIAEPFANPLSETTYELTVVDTTTGCSNTDQVVVTPYTQPAEAGVDQVVCLGGTILLDAMNYGDSKTYSWFPTTGLSNPNIAQPEVTGITDLTYTLTVTDTTLGCIGIDTVRVMLDDTNAPTAYAGADKSICIGESAQIGTNSSSGVLYDWSPVSGLSDASISNPLATPTSTTEYIITASNASGNACPQTDTVLVTVDALPSVNAGEDTLICTGDPGVQIGSIAEAGFSYAWLPTTGLNDPNIAQPIAQPTSTTTYTLFKTNTTTTCSNTDKIEVQVAGLPSVYAGLDTLICGGESVTLGANAAALNYGYLWNPTATLNDSTIAQPLATPTTQTDYVLLLTYTTTGCRNRDTVNVNVIDQPTLGEKGEVCAANGTGGDKGDDFFIVTLTTTNVNPGDSGKFLVQYNGTILNPSGTNYGTFATVGTNEEFAADGSTTYTFELFDFDKNDCVETIEVGPVNPCSSCPVIICTPVTTQIKYGGSGQ